MRLVFLFAALRLVFLFAFFLVVFFFAFFFRIAAAFFRPLASAAFCFAVNLRLPFFLPFFLEAFLRPPAFFLAILRPPFGAGFTTVILYAIA